MDYVEPTKAPSSMNRLNAPLGGVTKKGRYEETAPFSGSARSRCRLQGPFRCQEKR